MAVKLKCIDPAYKKHHIWQSLNYMYRHHIAPGELMDEWTRNSQNNRLKATLRTMHNNAAACRRNIRLGHKAKFYNKRTLAWLEAEQARLKLYLST